MLHKGLDFHTLKVTCSCGWFRNIAHSGCADGKRAIVKIIQSKDPSHVLYAKVKEISESLNNTDWKKQYPDFVGLFAEAYDKGLLSAMDEYSYLLEDKSCPRCKDTGQLKLEQECSLEQHVRY